MAGGDVVHSAASRLKTPKKPRRVSIIGTAARRAGKDAGAVRRWLDKRALWHEVLEMAREDGPDFAINWLAGVINKRRSIKNRKAVKQTKQR